MAADSGDWRGTILLRRLLNNLRLDEAVLDLYVHSLWSLFQERPYLLRQDPTLAASVRKRTTELLLDGRPILSPIGAPQLERIHFGVGLMLE
jgi:hypothetical protein